LASVEDTLCDSGHLVRADFQKRVPPQNGIRINGKLSFRGIQKAEEFFSEILDSDDDGLITFEDFRAMMSLSSLSWAGFVHEEEFSNGEAWRMYMADLGVHVSPEYTMTLPSFILYRQVAELQLPLARDLSRTRLGFLPQKQQQWCAVKALIQDVFSARVDNKEDVRLDISEVQYVLCNAGVCFDRTELLQTMLEWTRHEKVVKHVHLKLLKRYLTEAAVVDAPVMAKGVISAEAREHRERLKVDKEAVSHVLPAQLLAWFFSGHNYPKIPSVYQACLAAKYRICRIVRQCTDVARWAWDLATFFRERRCFKSMLALDDKDQKQVGKNSGAADNTTNWSAIVEVGNDAGKDEGFTMSWYTAYLDNPIPSLVRLGIPKDCGLVFSVDFLLRSGVKAEDAKLAAEAMKDFLNHQFQAELTRNQQYRSLFVTTEFLGNDIGNIIRLAVAYRRQSTVDAWLEQALAPIFLGDVLTSWSGLLCTSITPMDLLDSAYANIDSQLTAKITSTVEFRNDLLIDLLNRAAIALRSVSTDSRAGATLATSGDRFKRTVAKKTSVLSIVAKPKATASSKELEEKARKLEDSLKHVLGWVEWVQAYVQGHKVVCDIHLACSTRTVDGGASLSSNLYPLFVLLFTVAEIGCSETHIAPFGSSPSFAPHSLEPVLIPIPSSLFLSSACLSLMPNKSYSRPDLLPSTTRTSAPSYYDFTSNR